MKMSFSENFHFSQLQYSLFGVIIAKIYLFLLYPEHDVQLYFWLSFQKWKIWTFSCHLLGQLYYF